MEWWGPAHTFEQNETPDELVFVTVRTPRKAEAAAAIVLSLAAIGTLFLRQFVWSFLLAFAAAFAAAEFFSRKARRLSATERRLIGDSVRLDWNEIFELRYESGGEDGPSGLCARTSRWGSRCILQDVTRAESDGIISAIYRKWPALQMAERPRGLWEGIVTSLRGDSSN